MESLQTLKQALDASLITPADYELGKSAFLRAQQIRAGFEAGLLSPADYVLARPPCCAPRAPLLWRHAIFKSTQASFFFFTRRLSRCR